MLIDFCNEGLVESIWCSVSESDGYCVKNLISLDSVKKQKGFLAERFIRPPVSICIKFVEHISINHVVLYSSNGSQTSSGVELFTGDTELIDKFLAKSYLNTENGFIFHRFNDKTLEVSHKNLFKSSFRSARYLNVRYLKVNIIKTRNTTVPTLRKIEVWGKLSNTCSDDIKNKISNVWLEIKKASEPLIRMKRKITNVESQPIHNDNSSNICEPIPDEFLDAITYELMEVPMVLPSGKIVDLKTLERYNSEQESYGRSANDPFTGKFYSEISKPVYSSSLKLRIDEFLSRNSSIDDLKHSSRTVGLPSGRAKVCRLVSKDTVNELSVESRILNSDCSTQTSSQNRKQTFSNKPIQIDLNDSKDKSSSKFNISSFDSLKSDSLNASLKQFLSKSAVNNREDSERVCCSVCGTEENLYQIPCEHYMCRSCTTVRLADKESRCSKCSTPFKSSDIVKTHSSTISSNYRIS
ncbi:RING finger protein 37 [Nilaparvata lugens]|uniref:RING finger protein 37 n=1 Tax=Nilaparvata lugens TaxID=108931 RepID=UPI00193DB13E|nr:RING finger protein 37 [Nilaparvata lugens]